MIGTANEREKKKRMKETGRQTANKTSGRSTKLHAIDTQVRSRGVVTMKGFIPVAVPHVFGDRSNDWLVERVVPTPIGFG